MISPALTDVRLSTKELQHLNGMIKNSKLVNIDPAKINQYVKKNPFGAKLQLPVSQNLTLDLTIQQNEIRSADYHAAITTDHGTVADTALMTCNTYSGYANGDPSQFVRLYIDDSEIKGVVSDGKGGFYAIEPLASLTNTKPDNRYVVFNTNDVNNNEESCGMNEPISMAVAKANNARVNTTASAKCRILEIATDADYEYYLGNRANSNARILNDMNIIAGIYLNTFNIRIVVTYQHVFATKNDPYTAEDAAALLSEEKNYWNKNHSDIKRDVVHLFTGKILDGLTLGIAYKGTVGNPSRAYSLTSSTAKEYATAAHEIGHNLNASHPQDAASGCGTTSSSLMCSGLNKALLYSDFSQGEINAFIEANESVLLASDYNFSILGDSSICSTTTFRTNLMGPAVSWSSSNTALVTIDPLTGIAKRVGSEIGLVTITANMDLCGTPITITKEILAGLPSISLTGQANANGEVSVAVTEVPYGQYNWYLDGKLVSTGADYLKQLDGGSCGDNHFVQATVTNACGTTPMSNQIAYRWECTNSGVNVYPNPAKDVVSLDFDASSNKELFAQQIFLYNENSKMVRSISNSSVQTASLKSQLNVADLPRGTYYLHVIPSDGSKQKKDIKRIILE